MCLYKGFLMIRPIAIYLPLAPHSSAGFDFRQRMFVTEVVYNWSLDGGCRSGFNFCCHLSKSSTRLQLFDRCVVIARR